MDNQPSDPVLTELRAIRSELASLWHVVAERDLTRRPIEVVFGTAESCRAQMVMLWILIPLLLAAVGYGFFMIDKMIGQIGNLH